MPDFASVDRLSTRRQFTLVLRVAVEVSGEVSGELIDPISEERRRFSERDVLLAQIGTWIDDVVQGALADDRRSHA